MTNQVFSAIGRVFGGIANMMAISASRHQLAELDDAALRDLGISRAQARFEAARSPWDDTQVDEWPRGARKTKKLLGNVPHQI